MATPPEHDAPLADVTARMELFGRLFGEHAAGGAPAEVPDAASLVELVRTMVPRSTRPGDDAPVFEAAAFIGEWIRARVGAAWVAEGAEEPYLRVEDPTSTIVYVVPLVNIVRVASSAGYDGLATLLDEIVSDASVPPAPATLPHVNVRPRADTARVAAWVQRNVGRDDEALATLWRRCSACSTFAEEAVSLPAARVDIETLAGVAARALAERPFHCVCGGVPGDASRFLMLRRAEDGHAFVDIWISRSQTRIASWRVEGDRLHPLAAVPLADAPTTAP